MKRLLLIPVLSGLCLAESLTLEALQKGLSGNAEAFDELSLTGDGKTTRFEIGLGGKSAKIGDDEFDGFRFRCPDLPDGAAFIWYFNAPAHWANWYILPVGGEPRQAFRDWLEADKLYTSFDKPGEKDRFRTLQTLSGDYFKAGEEYILWFRKTGEGKAGDLRGLAAFAEDREWDHEKLEKALGLKNAPAPDQVAGLSSRGGLILLDDRFFEPGYAAHRIDSVFTSLRQTKRMNGGFFLTMKIMTPPCGTSPSLEEIQKVHGTADFVRDGEETRQVREHAGGTPPDESELKTVSHYYDYFALETRTGAEKPKVLRVGTHASDFSALRPPAKGSAFARLAACRT